MAETDLKFDEEKVSTKLAEEYLKSKTEFHSIGYKDSGEYKINQIGQKIYFTEVTQALNLTTITPTKQYSTFFENNKSAFLKLYKKIMEKKDLFCQLEFLIRKIPINDTFNIDLNLILQAILHQTMCQNPQLLKKSYILVDIGDHTPLFNLGLFAWQMFSYPMIISCTAESVAVCTLFVELCNEVGFHQEVKLKIVKSVPATESVWGDKGVGVVSEKSDIDSAVDNFLYATTRYPWRLSKVFVQESAMERFKHAMQWKTTLRSSTQNVDEHLRSSCTTIYGYEGKLFLHEFVGDEKLANSPKTVTIEAYRTVKELMSLLGDLRPLAVSLWCSDVAESNEISLGVDVDIVWINGYGTFQGPAISSEALYCSKLGCDYGIEEKTESDWNIENTLRLKDAWLKLPLVYRYEKIRKVYENHVKEMSESSPETMSDDDDDVDDDWFKNNFEFGLASNSVVSVDGGLCTVIRKPVGGLVVEAGGFFNLVNLLNYIIDGGAILMCRGVDVDRDLTPLCRSLTEIGAPIYCIPEYRPGCNSTLRYNTKAIWTNIGTVFSN